MRGFLDMRKEQLHPKREFTDVRALIEWAGEEYGERYAYSYRKNAHDEAIERITFAQLRDDVRALASSLMKMGCAHRHCVIVGKFSYEWVLTYFSVLSIGGVLVPLDPEWQPADLAEKRNCIIRLRIALRKTDHLYAGINRVLRLRLKVLDDDGVLPVLHQLACQH